MRFSWLLIAVLLTAFATSASAQTADTLTITVQPTSVQANETFNITVQAQDSTMSFAVDTSYTANVTLAIGSGPGALNGPVSMLAVLGEAAFTGLSLTEIGSVVIDADDGLLPTGSTTAITVTADRLVITVPATIANTVAGANINGATGIEVRAQDGVGNTDANFGANVDVALQSGTGVLSGLATQGATAGVATFTGLSINLIGPKTLRFTTTGLTQIDSNSFDITPAADAALFFIQQPSNVQTGAVITPSITVRIRDQFGNDTASIASVTLAIGTNPGGSTLGGTLSRAGVAGLASFDDITLNNAGTGYTLTAASAGLTGDTSATFNVTATPTPTISLVGTLTAFTTTGVGVPSAEQSYSVSGANLTANITINAPTHFQVSTTSGAGFGAQVILSQTGGTVNSTPIFVRYNPGTTGSHNGNITHDSTGAAQQTRAVSGSIAGPAAVTLSVGSGNPGSQSVSPGSSATALVFRLTETGGGSTYTVTSVSADITVLHPTPGVAIATIQSISLRRGSTTLGSIVNGGAGWGVAGSVITVNFNALSSAITASTSADFRIVISFTGGTPPSPNPGFQASVASGDINSGASVTGGPVNGGTITLREKLPDDPFAEDKDDSCELTARGGPAWPLALLVMLAGLAALVRRRRGTE